MFCDGHDLLLGLTRCGIFAPRYPLFELLKVVPNAVLHVREKYRSAFGLIENMNTPWSTQIFTAFSPASAWA